MPIIRGQKAFVCTNWESGKFAQIHFLERNGSLLMRDKNCIATDPLEPRDDILRIRDAAAEQEQLRLARRQSERQFVMHPANRIGDHLIFIDHEELRTVATEEAGALRFQRRDDDPGVEIQREIARGDADIPAARAPFREFVVRERARRNGENRLAFEGGIKQFENVGLARAGRGLDDHILARPQSAHRLLLPEIGDDEIDLESLKHRRTSHAMAKQFNPCACSQEVPSRVCASAS